MDCIVKVDQWMDYIPFVSFINNGSVLAVKLVLNVLGCCIPSIHEKARSVALVDRLIYQKNACLCILLAISFLNMLVAFARDNPDAAVRAVQATETPQVPSNFEQRLAAQTAELKFSFQCYRFFANLLRKSLCLSCKLENS